MLQLSEVSRAVPRSHWRHVLLRIVAAIMSPHPSAIHANRLCYPVEKRHYEQIAAWRPTAELVDAGQERIADEILRADIFCGHAKVPVDWDGGRPRRPAAVDSIVGRRPGPLPGAGGRRVGHHRHQRLGRAGRPGGRAAMALADWHWRGACRSSFAPSRPRSSSAGRRATCTTATVGIVGFGGIGRRIAEVLSPFKTRILATDMFPVDKPDVRRGALAGRAAATRCWRRSTF